MTLRTKVYGLIGLLALTAAGAAVWKTKPPWFPGFAAAKAASANNGKDKKGEKEAIPVELATARRGEISSFITATANLRALREVAVSTQAEGIVEKVLAEEGDYAKEGQLLCQLDDTQLRIRLELAREKLAQARLQGEKAGIREQKATAQIGHTQAELNRYERAHKEGGLVSEREVATYRYRLEELVHDQKASVSETKELQHRVSELEAEIDQSNLEISRTRIKAPFAGHITQRMVNVGQRVRPLDALFNLGAFTPLFADVHLSERDARLVRPGQSATIRLGSDEASAAQGRVERLSPIVDQSSGTVKVTIALQPAGEFRPGAFVRVDIRTDIRTDAVLVPKRAIVEEDGQNYLFIANGDSAKRTKVELGYSSEGVVEVRRGIEPGQKIVVAGQGAIKEGAKIKVIQG